ncbi:asparagine synthase-related protein [Roseateles sp.]|uniref:asparagine synthase-related protein n=1 Tax=Roseateles sp. TaxID=1971397 RepID=UPI0025F86864|nr:asparagine synthase-related protein [Roseateles sp.]MBV8034510.1 hypothetical protein [Roseateles sp.]
MFRYIGFSWAAADAAQSDLAERLDQALRSHKDWDQAFCTTGLRVYTAGTLHGINDVHALPSNSGVVLGRLFRRRALAPGDQAELTLTEAEAQHIAQSEGRALIDRFWGRYVAFLPASTGEGRVLRDPTGALPCFRMEVQGAAIVLSRLEDLLSLLNIPSPPVNWDAAAAHLLFGRLDGRETTLEGVTQMISGELTSMNGHGSGPLRLWSAADFARRPLMDSSDAARVLRETAVDCVQGWASSYDPFVLRLSGGVDSAILLGCLGLRRTPSKFACLNYHALGTDSDERPYARLAARRAGATLIERSLDDQFRLEEVLNVTRTPLPANYLGGMGTARTDADVAAAHRASAIFTGAGGDQLFFEFRRTWPAADYLKLHGFGLGLLEASLDSARLGKVSFWKAFRLAVTDQAFRGGPANGADRFSTLMRSQAREAAARTAERFSHPSRLDASDLPIGKFHQLGMLISPFEYYNHYLCGASPELVHPLMSQPLLELCLAIPTYVLTQGGRGRALARMAFADYLPVEISTRRSKGGMDMYATAILQRNLPFARELLLDGLLARQGLLDRPRVEAALTDRPSSAATYISEIHACIATEAWLQRMAAPVVRRPA